jgi:hypothetical protein
MMLAMGGFVFGFVILVFIAIGFSGYSWEVWPLVLGSLGVAWACGLASSWIQRHSLRVHWLVEFFLPVRVSSDSGFC